MRAVRSIDSNRRRAGYVSLGTWVILTIAVVSSIAVALWPEPARHDLQMWTFARNHHVMYEPIVRAWNRDHPDARFDLFLLSNDALTRRMMNGFLSGTPVADAIEVERNLVGQVFAGPLEDVGFVDLTDRIHEEGLDEVINTPSFSPWMKAGRIFGLPHDVHPVLLAYRADIIEDEFGIDPSTVQTWDEFFDKLRPLVDDLDGDGRPDRYILNLWETQFDTIEALLMQGDGGLFDADGRLTIATERNAELLCRMIPWVTGPGRVTADTPNFSASGNRLRLEGFVLAEVMPDWLAGVWKLDLPSLGGKVKLMPLPAWEPGGRRTTVMGGTMLGVTKRCADFETVWGFAKELYLSPALAERLFRETNIISPVRTLWDEPYYAEPDPYFSGQPSGLLFIEQAPHVPLRTSGPYVAMAKGRTQEVFIALRQYAEATGNYEPRSLQPLAMRLLEEAEARVREQMERNVFIQREAEDSGGSE